MDIFDYDNIQLLPRQCRVNSRSECDPSIEFGPRRFKLPAVPANMKTVIDEPIARFLAANDYFYVMHRFDLDAVAFARRMRAEGLYVSISLGVQKADFATVEAADCRPAFLLNVEQDDLGVDASACGIAHLCLQIKPFGGCQFVEIFNRFAIAARHTRIVKVAVEQDAHRCPAPCRINHSLQPWIRVCQWATG